VLFAISFCALVIALLAEIPDEVRAERTIEIVAPGR
jgi:hypothetical protein